MVPAPSTICANPICGVDKTISFCRCTGTVCGAVVSLLGLTVLISWITNSAALAPLSRGFLATAPAAGVCFCLLGLALCGVAVNRAGLVCAGSVISGIVAAAALAMNFGPLGAQLSHISLPVSSGSCFLIVASGYFAAQILFPEMVSAMVGLSGLAAIATAGICGIPVIWGAGDAFGTSYAHLPIPSAAGFFVLGIGSFVTAFDTRFTRVRPLLWAPVGTALTLAVVRVQLLQTLSRPNQGMVATGFAYFAAVAGAIAVGIFVHLALKTRLQREMLRTANAKLSEEMMLRAQADAAVQTANERLERRVDERTQALESLNRELWTEIKRRQSVEEDLRRQKEILQKTFDHVPVMLKFVDANGRIQMANPEWERTLGLTLEDLKSGADVYAENYPDPLERGRALDFIANSNGEWVDFKTRAKDGRTVDTTWAVARLSDGSSICIGQDISARKHAEEGLRQQKEVLQTIFDHAPVMMSFADDHGLLLVNREWEKTVGWTLEEVRAKNVDLFAENYPDPKLREQAQNFVRNSRGEWSEFQLQVRDGRVLETSWVMLDLPDGSHIGIGRDITSRKKAERALLESEERFRQLAENIDELFWIKTPDFKRVLYLSPAFEKMSGRTREERYNDTDSAPFLNMLHPEDREKMAAIIRNGVQEPFDIEFRIMRADGSMRWIHDRGFPVRDASGAIYRLAGIARDVTERKIAEQALRESEERFRQLAENISEIFWITTLDLTEVLYLSPGSESLTGEPAQLWYASSGVRKCWLDVVYPEDLPRVMGIVSAQGQEFDIEFRVIRRDGAVRWLRNRGFPIRNENGAVYRMAGVAEDITDRKEAEQRLMASTEQLRALSASLHSAREKEAARIAQQIHDDLGGFLTCLRWELEELDKMVGHPAAPFAAVRNKIGGMIHITDNTIQVVRGIASELRPRILDDLGLAEAIEWQAQQFQSRTGIVCHCDCSVENASWSNDRSTAVFRIVQEALTNILRHANASRVIIGMREENQAILVTVSDNGRGITELEKLNRNSLGLFGMRERANLVGGDLEIEGKAGRGTVLSVRLPVPLLQRAGAVA